MNTMSEYEHSIYTDISVKLETMSQELTDMAHGMNSLNTARGYGGETGLRLAYKQREISYRIIDTSGKIMLAAETLRRKNRIKTAEESDISE